MSGPIASSRVRSPGWGRFAPAAAVLLVALLAGLSVASTMIVAGHFKDETLTVPRLYSELYRGLNNSDPNAALTALVELGIRVDSMGIPLVLTDPSGQVLKTANTPFPQTPGDPLDPKLLAYVKGLDRVNAPLTTPGFGSVHYGPAPATSLLLKLGVLQALTIIIMVLVGFVAYRSATTSQRDRLWVAMAREAAHQMGTPLTSLQGWIEQLRGAAIPPDEVAEHLVADADRLQRVANRFERIGNPARREAVALGALAERVAGYFRPRLPHLANAITLEVQAPSAGPMIIGDPVLLEWVLEALVKNAIDALHGRGGTITLVAGVENNSAVCRVIDDGPGVPREMRRTIFEPGITTKRGGWGIGLALARRVIEDAHDGGIALEPLDDGTAFLIRLPLAPSTPAA